MKLLILVVVVAVVCVCRGDVYLHCPRGSNNRLDETTAARDNANRMFDSQNNDRGGYNIGDKTSQPANGDYKKQFHMKYFMSDADHKSTNGKTGTHVRIAWTNQHGCGGTEGDQPQKNMFCQIILQFMCRHDEHVDAMRDGTSRQTQNYDDGPRVEKEEEFQKRKNKQVKEDRGLHETFEWYDKCHKRERNKGLFTADQNLKGQTARYTRQNAGGTRRGYECPEERDYYPYWHPTDWKDIAVFVENKTLCEKHYTKESFNVKSKWECMELFPNCDKYRHYSRHNNKKSCEDNEGKWLEFHNYLEKAPQHPTEEECKKAHTKDTPYFWGRPMGSVKKMCLVALPAPDCVQAPYSRDNHLGNGVGVEMLNYDWVLPHFPSLNTQRCVLRIRYNISTGDYNRYTTDSNYNAKNDAGNKSPVRNNPKIPTGFKNFNLQLAVNTAQFGRTFSDRTHVFYVEKRPDEAVGHRIHNLNVRGKRGNIQQVQNAVEYDFCPVDLHTEQGDLIHFQWAGSNTHNNKGQGNDGEGKEGTDRNNIVQIEDRYLNYAPPLTKSTMFTGSEVIWTGFDKHGKKAEDMTDMDVAVTLASSGYYTCASGCKDKPDGKGAIQAQLNNAPASFPGLLVRLKATGTHHYMCTRNNNFSNRSQKGTIVVGKSSTGVTIGVIDKDKITAITDKTIDKMTDITDKVTVDKTKSGGGLEAVTEVTSGERRINYFRRRGRAV